MARAPLKYRAPAFLNRRHKPGDVLVEIVRELEERSRAVEANANLSDQGRLADFSQAAVAPFKRLTSLRKALRAKAQKIADEEAALTDRVHTPEMSALEHAQAFELFREGRTDVSVRAELVKELTGPSNDPRTVRLRKFALSIHPLLSGMGPEVYDHVRLKLEPTLPREIGDLEEQLAGVRSQIDHVDAALESIAAHTDHDVLRKAGAMPRPMLEWTAEERAEFIEEHGVSEFRAALDRERHFAELTLAEPPISQQPDPYPTPEEKSAAEKQREADLSALITPQMKISSAA